MEEINIFKVKLFYILDLLKSIIYSKYFTWNLQLTSILEEKKIKIWFIYIQKRQTVKLIYIVGPYMHESML